MDINQFFKKHNIANIDLKKYGNVTINRMNRIISGMVEPTYDHPTLCRLAGLYFHFEKKYDQAERYYQMAIEHGDLIAPTNLGNMYTEQKKYDLAEQYYLVAIKKGSIMAINNIGMLYHTQKKYDHAEQYYQMAIEHGDLIAPINLGNMYTEQKKYDLAEQYYLMAIKKGNIMAINNIGVLYYIQKKYDQAEQYYLMAVKRNESNAPYNLGILNYYKKKYDQAERYYLMALERGNNRAIDGMKLLYSNKLRLYNTLIRLTKNDLIERTIRKLEIDQQIRYFKNKKDSLSKKAECPICYEELMLIPRECAHYYCPDCYVRIDRCAFGCDND
jgi:TPR repeat protein